MAKGLHPTDWARYGTRLAGTRRKGHAIFGESVKGQMQATTGHP
jgi:hypothetical protein